MSIDYTKHSDKRVNNPTMEHRDFFVAEERKPYDTLYPRDPSLDPQLVWKGKDEQDREDLAVPTVPIYIQEKIHPSAIIEDLRRNSPSPPAPSPPGGRGDVEQLDLFGDFNHMELAPGEDPFAAQIDFYSHKPEHQKSWTNRMILGDSLLVMNSLAEKEGLKGKVQCIYIDPPYGIKFGSNWQVSTRKRDVKDGKAEDQAREPEVIRAFRDTWALGIHSYLSYLRDRFQVAQELLTETGSIFVQIGDENVHLVRCVLDEVFGAENFVGQITFAKTSSALERTTALPSRFDHILWYAKELGSIKMRRLTTERADLLDAGFTLRYENGVVRPLTKEEKADIASLAPETIAKSEDLTKPGPGAKYEVQFRGRSYNSGGRWWGMQKQSLERLIGSGRVLASGNVLRALRLASDFGYAPLDSVWSDTSAAPDPSYVVQTHPVVVQRCILMATDPGDLVLDPTCGSGTTAHVAEQWGRRWITIDTSRVALALARTRLMSARFPYYLLADSPEGVKKEAEISGQVPPTYPIANDIKKGFVYKRVPHVTLKSIANNPEIEGIAAEYDAKIEEALEYINGPHCFGTKDKPGPYTHETMRQPESIGVQGQIVAARQANCVVAAQRYWELRRARREAIDKAIAKHADTELLFDQPYEDKKRVRVTGPFTVE
ncbi:MAG TPA: site-specific DNA-methyltransferase, partial [Fimbriimonadaceae bacterium]|nr:site-specific DNA-methyltransferase [Fimbriimonadaceae bacterium]